MFRRIVVGLGKSKTGQRAATALGATLHVVTAFKPRQKDSARDRIEAERCSRRSPPESSARSRTMHCPAIPCTPAPPAT